MRNLFGHLVPSWSHLGAILEPTWGQLGASLGPSWAILGPYCCILGTSRAMLGHLIIILGHVGAILGPSGVICSIRQNILGTMSLGFYLDRNKCFQIWSEISFMLTKYSPQCSLGQPGATVVFIVLELFGNLVLFGCLSTFWTIPHTRLCGHPFA